MEDEDSLYVSEGSVFISSGYSHLQNLSSEKKGFKNSEGEFVIKPQFDDAFDFNEGLAGVKLGEKWGFINTKGEMVIAPQFEDARPFSEGLAPVVVNDKYGYIDKAGRMVIKPQFAIAYGFNEGLASVYIPSYDEKKYLYGYGNNWGFIDKCGRIVIKPQFSSVGNFSEGLASVLSYNGKYGYIDKTGKYIIHPKYDSAYDFNEGVASVSLNDEDFFIDKTGNIIEDNETYLEYSDDDDDGSFDFSKFRQELESSFDGDSNKKERLLKGIDDIERGLGNLQNPNSLDDFNSAIRQLDTLLKKFSSEISE